MNDHWQSGPPGPADDPSYGHRSPADQQGTGGYSSPVDGYGYPQASHHGSAAHNPGHYNPGYYAPGAYYPGPYGAPPPPQFRPVHPYYVPPPDRTSAVIALVVSILMLVTCMNPLGIAGLVFSSISLNETLNHARAARHARYAWYSVIGGFVTVLLFFGLFWLMMLAV